VLHHLGRKNEETILRARCYATGETDIQMMCDEATKT
jgi:hypothetical protein